MTGIENTPHIAHLVYSFRVGGLENGIVNLLNRLPADGCRHSIICLADYDPAFFARIRNPRVSIYALNKQPGQDVGLFLRLWRLLRRLRPTVMHSRNLATLECQWLAFMLRIPLRIHGEHGWDMADLAGNNRRYLWLRRLSKPWIHQFVALSREGVGYLRDRVSVPETVLHHICNGVDTDKFRPDLTPATPPASLAAEDAIWIGTVGRLARVKNQQLLAEAFIALVAARPQLAPRLRLLLVGDGAEKAAIAHRLQQAGVGNQAWLAGERSDIPALMNTLDIFVLPSLAEGISNTLLEAMACGLPIVATDVGGNGDLVMANETGYLVPVDDPRAMVAALARYLDDPELLRRHAANARQRALGHFGLGLMVSRYARLYGVAAPAADGLNVSPAGG